MANNFSRISIGFVAALAMLMTALPAQAQRANSETRPSPNAEVSQTIGTTEVDLHYGRPGVRGREVFGDMVPWGEPWRAGANEPTTITFSGEVQIEGQPLEAGTYNLFMRPRANGTWDVIITTTVRWGTMFDQATPVLTVSVEADEAPHQEWLQYRFEDLSDTSATLIMHWADMEAPVTISLAS